MPWLEYGTQRRLYAGPRKAFEVLLASRCDPDRMQRNFEPVRKQVELWRRSELTDVTAQMIIYQAFIESELEVPRHLARRVYDLYFDPQHDELKPRTLWSLSNAFTSAFKDLDPIPQFRATAKLGGFLEARFNQGFRRIVPVAAELREHRARDRPIKKSN